MRRGDVAVSSKSGIIVSGLIVIAEKKFHNNIPYGARKINYMNIGNAQNEQQHQQTPHVVHTIVRTNYHVKTL